MREVQMQLRKGGDRRSVGGVFVFWMGVNIVCKPFFFNFRAPRTSTAATLSDFHRYSSSCSGGSIATVMYASREVQERGVLVSAVHRRIIHLRASSGGHHPVLCLQRRLNSSAFVTGFRTRRGQGRRIPSNLYLGLGFRAGPALEKDKRVAGPSVG